MLRNTVFTPGKQLKTTFRTQIRPVGNEIRTTDTVNTHTHTSHVQVRYGRNGKSGVLYNDQGAVGNVV